MIFHFMIFMILIHLWFNKNILQIINNQKVVIAAGFDKVNVQLLNIYLHVL